MNAAEVMRAADYYTLDIRAKQIGVMTAIGESSLRNLDYGDSAGPDSRGLFQQRSNWGPLADRMDPYTAAFNFYHRLFGIVNWNTLPPTQVAHTVQGNADPNYYAKYFSRASRVVDGLLAHQISRSALGDSGFLARRLRAEVLDGGRSRVNPGPHRVGERCPRLERRSKCPGERVTGSRRVHDGDALERRGGRLRRRRRRRPRRLRE